MADAFSLNNFFLRLVFSILLVFSTYNPTDFSYVGWLQSTDTLLNPGIAIVGIVLLTGWIIFLRATFMSMGWLGIVLWTALMVCLVWLLVDIGWLKLESGGVLTWIALFMLSILLGIGMSWSHIRRRMTGQVDIDSLEDGRG